MSKIRLTKQQKRAIIERAGGCCEYCLSQARFAIQAFSIEHIIPRSRGGQTTLDNLALACQGCNNHKYTKTEGRDPVTGELGSAFSSKKTPLAGAFLLE
jgi:5-methylcytosine-specific restriction endonuclease McrA